MAEGGGLLNQEQFSCSICLDLLKDPVTVPCGHSFCMDCIKGCWDRDDQTGVYSCPQCRQTFTPRPVLGRATILAEVIEKLKKTGLQAAPPADSYAGPGDVVCDICTGRKYKAVKSCLVCLASYCEMHLQTHYESPALKKHKLAKATGNLQEKICSLHDKLLEVYCRADQQCICYRCAMDEHRGHDTVSAAAERIEKQKRLGATQSKFQQRIQEREKELQDLRQAVSSLKLSAQAVVEDSERIFTELIRSIERRCSEVKELIRDQQKAEVSRAEGVLERLEQEIAELRRRDAELQQLSHTEDHIHFLQNFESLCAPSEPGDLPNITVSPHGSFEAVRKSVSQLIERLEDVFKSELIKVSGKVGEVNVLIQKLKTGKHFKQFATAGPPGPVYDPFATCNSQYPLHTTANATPIKIKNSESLLGLLTSDSPPRNEQRFKHFKTADEAALCKTEFEEAQKVVPKSPQKQEQPVEKEVPPKVSSPQTAGKDLDFGALFAKKEGEWDCSVCCIRNSPADVKCVACQNPSPNAKSETDGKAGEEVKGFVATVPSAGTFTFGFGKNVSKDSSSASTTQPFDSFSQFPTTIKFETSDSTSKPMGFGAQFEKKPGQWDCNTCSVRNEASANQCISCQAPNPSSKPVFDSPAVSKSPTASFGAGFGSQFLKKEGEWDCSVCCVRNGPTAVKCVACQNPNPTAESEAEGKSGKEFKGFAATVPSAGTFTFGFRKDVSKDSSSPASTQLFDSFSQFPTTIKFGTSDSTSKPMGFGALFEKKPGQWDCSTCSVRNEASANQCAACQSLNSSSKTVFDSTAVSKSSTASFGAGFGSQFHKKEGEWDCCVCCIRNGPTAVKCVACQNPNPTAESEAEGKSGKEFKGFAATVPSAGTFTFGFGKDVSKDSSSTASTQLFDSFSQFPTTIKFGNSDSTSKPMGFRAQFEKKPGQWDCNTCCLRNEASANQCISCQAQKPSSKPVFDSPAASKPSTASSGAGFGSQFTKKEGQWDCDTCLLRNEASATKCASCMTPRKIAPNEGLAMFGEKEGQWVCGTCLVRNEASASACVSCQTPNPNANVASTSPANAPAPPSSAFTFSIGSMKASDAPATTGYEASFNIGTAFKFEQGEDKGSPKSFKFELPHSQVESKPSSSKGFSFSMPMPASPFKCGMKEPVKLAVPAEVSSDAGPASICLKNMAEQHREREEKEVVNAEPSQEGTVQEENFLFSDKQNTFSFAESAQSSQVNFQFGQKDPSFSGFPRAGEQLFASLKPSEKQHSAQDQDEENMYKTEEHNDIQFDPVVQMPEKVDLVTGDEDEEVLYSHRVKLFQFDADTSQWKERGVGNLKILKNNKNGKFQVVMRREQVFKVCAHHLITTTMNLKPLDGSDRAWMWLANDFSEGDANLEQLAAKFKTPEMAEEFKQKFEECQRLLLDVPLQTPHKLVDTGITAHLIQKAEEMKTGLKDLKLFLTDDKAKIKEQGSQVDDTAPHQTLVAVNKPHSEACMSLELDNYDLQEDALDKTAEKSVCTSPLATTPEVRKNVFRFGETSAGFSFSFQSIISPSKSPTKLNQSRASVGTDDESETQKEERDGPYFKPVVPLPDLVEISTGEENEQVVFCHRAKLYRYDKELNQWKDRGIGDLKILQNKDTKLVRLVMRRDQVLKLCANHWITSTMKLKPMRGAEKAWIWSPLDFSEGEGKVEQLAVRFKLLEVANAFKYVFEAAKNAEEENTVLTPVSTKECTPHKTTCGLPAVAALEETTRERTELPPQSSHDTDSSTSPAAVRGQQTPSKTIVSPPKFVFGSDSVQKIFGSPKSFSELVAGIKTSSKDKAQSVSSTSVNIPESTPVHPSPATPTPSMSKFKVPTRAAFDAVHEKAAVGAKADGAVEQGDSMDLQIVFVREPTAEQEALARSLLLPRTFFCFQNESGYFSDDSTDDEDYEAAVRKLNGKLYPDPPEAVTLEAGTPETVTQETVVHAAAPVDPPAGERDAECVIVWEKKPTPEEQERAARLQLPPTFFCGVGGDEGKKDKPDDFETELRKAQKDLAQQKRTEGSEVADPVVSSSSDAPAAEEQASPQPDSSSEATPAPSCPPQDGAPIDLSTKKGPETEPDSTSQGPTTAFAGFGGFGSLGNQGGFSFADLTKNTSDFAFGKQAPATKNEADQPGSDEEEAASSADVHFEPIVSLPKYVRVKERAKLFRWDCNLNQWKERGVGDIKILYHPQKRCYRVLMRRDQVLKVCANHTITQGMELVPMNTSNNALVWTATDYAEGSTQIEQLVARFKTAGLADSFRRTFEECLSRLSQADCGQMSRALEHSREGNPMVFYCVSADGEPLGKITMEPFSHIVPKTAENFRALCTGERGFGFRNSVFHRIIPDFMCQGGDVTYQDGTGGKSIYGEKFQDENFDVRHTGPGLLSMANRGRDTNNSPFFITLKKAEHLDFKHVAFGFVKDGMDVVKRMGELGTKSGKPSRKIVITDCGQLQ